MNCKYQIRMGEIKFFLDTFVFCFSQLQNCKQIPSVTATSKLLTHLTLVQSNYHNQSMTILPRKAITPIYRIGSKDTCSRTIITQRAIKVFSST